MTTRFDKVLVANRGEIARRILRTCRELGYGTVAVFSDPDRDSLQVDEADEAVHIGPAASRESYLVGERLIAAALATGAGAIHPGFGFLAENADFAAACAEAGLVFIGPTPESIRVMGSKIEAKRLAAEHDVPLIPGGASRDQSHAALADAARALGFPVLLKASAGGGGKGMRAVHAESELEVAIAAAKREAASGFGDDTLLVEKLIEDPRHIEVQILGDAHGRLVHLGERECSIQRRHQKIIEETPSTFVGPALREAITGAALRIGRALGYRSAGTVEFIVDAVGAFYFLEVNTRLQVEHPITELCTGLDLVALQLRVAQGEPLGLTQEDIVSRGHAIECRLYAEDPGNGFLPATGRLVDFHFPDQAGLRVDTGVATGDTISIHYDPMIAKVVTWGADRAEATRRMCRALDGASVQGLVTNRAFLLAVLKTPAWAAGETHTSFIDRHFARDEDRAPATKAKTILRHAVAATLAAAEASRRGPRPLASIPLAFRNSRWRATERGWQRGDATIEVTYSETGARGVFAVTVAGEELAAQVRGWDGTTLRLELDGHVGSYRVVTDGPVDDGGRCWVHGLGAASAFTALPRFPEAADDTPEGGCVAPMPGTVLKVLVAPEQDVAQGDPLVIMEAMKMEHTLTAPATGRVTEVRVDEGDSVEADAVLVVLETAE